MFTKDEATKERINQYVKALQTEKQGLQARLERVKAGRVDPVNASEESLLGRIKDVDAELKRAKALKPKPTKQDEEDGE